jgi:hypothetical protein
MAAIVVTPAAQSGDKDIGGLVAVHRVDRVAIDIGKAVRAGIGLPGERIVCLGRRVGRGVGVGIRRRRRNTAAQ